MDFVYCKKLQTMKDSLLYGTLLGDSWIYKDKRGNYVFAFSQVNKEYALWKADLLGFDYKTYDVSRLDKRTKKVYTNLTVHVKIPLEKRKELHSIFYQPKKIVTKQILDSLDDMAICLWFLDDGNMYYNGNNCHLQLSTDSFDDSSQDLIVKYFKDKYGIDFKRTKKCIRLVSKRECEKFMLIVEKHIPECMEYKKLSSAIANYKLKKKI